MKGCVDLSTHSINNHSSNETFLDTLGPSLASLELARFGSSANLMLVALCAEPEMGQRDLITEVLAASAAKGRVVIRHGFEWSDAESASRTMARVARSAARAERQSVVAFDDVPPSDESFVRRQARSLRRLWEAGIPTVFSLAPEGRALLELLPECRVLSSRDLLFAHVASTTQPGFSCNTWEMTHGIPTLVRAFRQDAASFGSDSELGYAYEEALRCVVSGLFRRSLSDGELRLRLCLLLLGRGSRCDIELTLGRVPSDLLCELRDDVPLFSFNVPEDSFSSIGYADDHLLSCGASLLEDTCIMFPDVVAGCVRVLLDRGEYGRAVRVCALPNGGDALRELLRSGPCVVDAGGARLVEQALGVQRAEAPYEILLSGAARTLLGEAPSSDELASMISYRSPLADELERDALALIDAGGVLRGEPALISYAGERWSELGRRLLAHREVADLLLRGKLRAATRVLVANPEDGDCSASVSMAILRIDGEIARLLLCDRETSDEVAYEAAKRLLCSSGAKGLVGYVECAEMLEGVLSGDIKQARVAASVSRAERVGDVVVQVLALTAGCVLDLRSGALARANVRSLLASAIASRAGLDYIARTVRLLGTVARFCLGEGPGPEWNEEANDDLAVVERFVCGAMLSSMDGVAPEGDACEEPPHEALWMLVVLCEGIGEFSPLLSKAMPVTWWRALKVARANLTRCAPGKETHDRGVPSDDSWRDGPSAHRAPIRISLLGGFAISVNGVRILDGQLEQRGVKSMLTYLALCRAMTAKRHQVVDQLWPGCDYAAGFNRAYQATSALRAAIAEIDDSLDPFVVGRASKTISMDTSLVCCDVDEFRECAREASDAQSDEKAIRMARRVEQLYAGDLYEPAMDATGYVALVRDELRELYADAMTSGAESSLRLGRLKTATRMSFSAVAADDLREDALIVLVRSLKASGRAVEAERQYRRYERRLRQALGVAPSKRLRDLMEDRGEVNRG